ncbi:MAG: MTH1187 family thiamine-binding protein [Chloroflexi bacterium]|nr:MTH1187 family thiamine-binding protein [Chloroflexota bacterium]
MKESVIANVTIIPVGTAHPSLSHYIAACFKIVKQAQGISYQLTAMGTTIQGPLERVLELVKEIHEVPFTQGAQRVFTAISIDDRRDKAITIEGKVQAVKQLAD